MFVLSKESVIYILMACDREVMIPSFKQISPPQKKALYEILEGSITLTN